MVKSGFIFAVSKYLNVVPEIFFETGRKTLKGEKTSDLFLLNAGINSGTLLKHFEISLKARNILNRKYYFPGGYEHVQDEIIQDSRNIYIKLMTHF
jgi:hypothetical protein